MASRDIPETRRLVSRVRSRAAIALCLRATGLALAIGGGVALGGTLLGKYMAWPLLVSLAGAWPVFVAIVGVAWVVGIVFGMARMPGVLAAASMADRTIGRSDHIRSALELAPRERGDAFVAILLRDAERAASESDPARVVPITLGRSWAVGGVLMVAACCAVIWLPARSIDRDQTVARADPAAARVASEVARAAQEVRAVSEATGPAISKRDAERLADIERELREGGMRSEDARAEAASMTASLAERAEREADQSRVASERLRDIASAASRAALDAGRESEPGGEAEGDASQALDPRLDELLNSLAEGDVGRAADLARELAEGAESLSPEERSRMAEQLNALARAIESEAARSAQAMGENADAERATETAAQEQETQSGGEQGQTTPDRGVEESDPIDAAADASEREQREREREVEEQGSRTAERDAKSIAEAARQAADELRKPAFEGASAQDQREPGASSPERESERSARPDAGAGAEQRASDAQGDSRSESGAREDQRKDQQGQAAEKKDGGAEGESQRSAGEGAAERQGGAGEGDEQQAGRDQAAGREQGAAGEGEGKSAQGAQEQGQAEQGESGQKQGGQEQGGQEQGGQEQGGQEQGVKGSDDRAQQGDRQTGSGERGSEQSERPREASGNQGQSEQRESGDQGERRQGAEGAAREGEQVQRGEQGERSPQQSDRPADEQADPSRGAPSGLERFQQALRNAAERNADARRQQDAAERLRDVSERLAGGGEREPGERGASRRVESEEPRSGSGLEQFAGEGRQGPPGVPQRAGSGPTSIEEVQGPRDDGSNRGGRVAGERPSELSGPREIAPITPGALREAASGIERAIEQQSVPDRRSDLVRRVFQRYRDRAETQSGSVPTSDRQ